MCVRLEVSDMGDRSSRPPPYIYRGEHVPLLRRNVMETTLGLISLNFSVFFLPQIFQHVFDAFSASGRSPNTGPVHKNQPFKCEKTLSTTRTEPSGECGLSCKDRVQG